jgi:phosphoribosyl 1,2-cyclic phosphate phosphodiesterase
MKQDKMRLTFLGTGTSTGVPVIGCDCDVCSSEDIKDKRFRTSAMIEVKGKRIIIDCGPDFRIQLLRNNVDDLDGIFFTHGHRDHTAGIDDVRGFNYIHNKAINVYTSEEVLESIKVAFPYIFNTNGYMGAPKLDVHIIENKTFDFQGIPVTPILVKHKDLDVYGFRIFDLCYITDANYIAPEELEKIKGVKVLVLNALRNSKHLSHFSLSEAIDIVNIIKPEKAYFTHMSHFIGRHEKVENELPENIHLAYDNLSVEIELK